MASGENGKIRLVKCPKCMRLLPELADVPVYECGGCGTILQAKIRRNDLENTRLALPKTGSVHSPSVLEQVSKDKGSTSASQNQNFLQVENGSQPEDLNIPKQVSSSVKTALHDNEDLPVVDKNGANTYKLGSSSNGKLHDTSIRSLETTTDEPGTEIVASSTRVSLSHGIDRMRPRENLETIDLMERSSNQNFLQVENGSQPEDLNIPKQVSSSVKTDLHDNDDLPAVDENGTNTYKLGSSSNGKLHDTSIRSLETTTDELGTEIVASSMRVPPFHGIDRIRPIENLDTKDLMERISELSDGFEDISTKSPTNRYMRANGGSVSCNDGTDDQDPDPHLHLYRRNIRTGKFKGAQQDSFEDGKMGRNEEMQRQLKNSLSSETRYYSMQKSTPGDQMNEDESPMVPFYSGSPSPSCHWNDEFQCSSSFCSPDDNLQYEHERMKLLRMVYELQNQLEGTHMRRGHAYAYPKGSRHETRVEENWAHHCRFSQKPFSRESPNYRRQQADHVYLNPYKEGLYGAHNSSSSTPRRHINPEVPIRYMDSPFSLQSRDSRFDDKKQKDQHMIKQHFRPMAGGAPFLTCYHCLKPLQLPADFLRFEKNCHRLRCGACKKILKFLLRNSSHILPYAPNSSEACKNMSSESVEERKMKMSLFKPSRNGYKDHPMKSESVGTSSKRFDKEKRPSAIEELGPKRGPALHSLMGYDSPSQVIRGFDERQCYTSDSE